MAYSLMASIGLRPNRLVAVTLSAALLCNSLGCSHRRSAMRPVFVGAGYAPSAATSGDTVITEDSVPSSTPPVIRKDRDADLEPELAPVKPKSDPGVRKSGGTPPPADQYGEPDLKVKPERTPKANILGPELSAPNASRGTGLRTSGSTRTRQASLRENVRPFVNDADDLFQPPKTDRSWKYVVVHHSANATGSYDQIDREHRKIQGWDGCGYHFVIGNGTDSPDGQIEVARRWANQKHGLHCRNGKNPDVNEYGIGICLIGDLDQKPPTPKQIAAARALVAYLADRYQLPSDNVGTHAELAESETACPGKYFPEEQIFGTKHLAARQ